MAIQLQGYYENGNYFINDTTSIPNMRTRITVIFHDEKAKQQRKTAAIKAILTDALNAERELTDIDWGEMADLRAQTNAGLSSRVAL